MIWSLFSSFKSWQFVNIWNTPFFWLYKIIIIMLRGHITLSENCWSCAFIESWCAKIKSVTKTNIYFNTDEIKINLDEILPEWNTHLRQVVRGTNTFNGLVMMPNSLAVSITIYVYAHTNVRRYCWYTGVKFVWSPNYMSFSFDAKHRSTVHAPNIFSLLFIWKHLIPYTQFNTFF